MASYVIHHIAGKVLLDTLEKEYNCYLSKQEKNHFFMGNLIPDSSKLQFSPIPDNISPQELKQLKKERSLSIQKEKQKTHFRSQDDLDKNIQVPNIKDFLEKYESLLSKDISVLGYLFHLYTDKIFFGDLFLKNFIFLNDNKEETDKIADTRTIILRKNNQEYEATSLFNNDNEISIYHDYTIMNTLLLSKYNITFPLQTFLNSTSTFINPGINEVDYSNITGVLNKTSRFINESKQLSNITLKVFASHEVESFISDVVSSFISIYSQEITSSINNKLGSITLKKTPVV